MAENKRVKVLLNKEMHDDIRQLSRLLGVSVPELLNEASGLLMRRYEKVLHRIKITDGKDPNNERHKDLQRAAR